MKIESGGARARAREQQQQAVDIAEGVVGRQSERVGYIGVERNPFSQDTYTRGVLLLHLGVTEEEEGGGGAAALARPIIGRDLRSRPDQSHPSGPPLPELALAKIFSEGDGCC